MGIESGLKCPYEKGVDGEIFVTEFWKITLMGAFYTLNN